ncbi:hypothetical protein RB594_002184 [Gaeumannomyces avenae]
MELESLEQAQARHRKELKDLQGRITSKKKNATKKTRKGVSDECAELERQTKERHEAELRALSGEAVAEEQEEEEEEEEEEETIETQTVAAAASAAAATATEADPPAPSSSKTTTTDEPPPPQQAAGKKRNRQKERLARRAAEQEAAVEQAAAEAAGMVDHRSAEAAHMARELAAHALAEKAIAPDGHCLFSAVADQLSMLSIPLQQTTTTTTGNNSNGGQDDGGSPYRVVRRAAAAYIASHAGDFAPFLEEPLESYVRKIGEGAEWGGHMELLALASTYGVEVRVVADGRTAVVRPAGREGEGEEPLRQIWLAYYRHGFGLGEHYNSLRKKEAVV